MLQTEEAKEPLAAILRDLNRLVEETNGFLKRQSQPQLRDKGIAETENMNERYRDRSVTSERPSDPRSANKEVLNMVNSWERQQQRAQ